MQPKIETAGMARKAMLEKMEESGLDIRDLKQLGFEAFTARELAVRYPKLTEHLGAGFILPYFDPEGVETGFFRYRYLERPQIHGFKALTLRDKKFKYIQPSKVPPRLYFSPFINWMEYLSKPPEDRPLIITEGELKAACATKLGLAVLGLGGVWNFRGGTKELVISDLKRLPLKDIRIYIVFDSDTITNAQVIIAENALAKELLNLGAEVFVVRLPSIFPEKDKKTGLDDFLVARGANDFIELMAETAPWDRSRALHELNEEVVLVRNPGLIVKLENMQRMSLMQFQSVVYANRTIEIAAADKNGKVKLTRKPLAPEWVHWPHRAEVERVTYAPGEPSICPPDENRKDYELNTWPGWGLDTEIVVKGDIKPWHELLDFIFSGDRSRASDRKWFEQWLAYPLQNPGTKMYSAVVVWGRLHGTGKCLATGTPVLMFDGSLKPVEEIKNGDRVMGPDSKPRTVSGTVSGYGPMYRVNPTKGAAYEVNDAHILSLRIAGKNGRYYGHKSGSYVEIEAKDFNKAPFKSRAMGWRTGIDFPAQSLPLEPYFLGLWLGDGTSHIAQISSVDKSTELYLKSYATRLGIKCIKKNQPADKCPVWNLTVQRSPHWRTKKGFPINPIIKELRNLNLLSNKHIPTVYKINDRRSRLELLAGLIDSDGERNEKQYGWYCYSSKLRTLAEDVAFLARSLGFAAYLKRVKKTCQNGNGGYYWKVSISGEVNEVPARVRPVMPRRQEKNVLNVSIKVKSIGDGEYHGFALDGDGLFLLGDFTVTHNTLVGYTMERIYGRNFAEIADKDLLGNFNEWAENKQFVLGDEITGGDKRASGDRMKGMITQKSLRMNTKFIPAYTVPDCINYYFTSNHPDSFFLEDTDRRYFIHEVTGKPLAEEFYRRYDAWYKSNAVGALQYHLLSLDMTGFNPLGHAPVTNSKLDMIDLGRSELAAWVNSFWDDPSNVGAPATYTLMTKGELFSVFCTNTNQNGSGRVTQQGLLKALRARGFMTVGQGAKIKTHFGMNQLWAVRNRDGLAKVTDLEKLAAVYNSEHPTASQFVKGVGA